MSTESSTPAPELVKEEEAMDSTPTDYPLLSHYSVLIYPFFHGVKPTDRRWRIQRLEESWSPWWSRLDGTIHEALDDTFFFLPYIREIVFPEVALFKDTPPGDQYANWDGEIRKWSTKGLNYLCSELPDDAVLRITYKRELLEYVSDITIVAPPGDGTTGQGTVPPMRLDWVDAILFPSGVGFLMMKFILDEASPRLSHLIGLNSHLRTVHPPFIGSRLTELRVNRTAYTVKMRDLTDFLTQGMTNEGPVITDLTQFMEHLRQSKYRRYSESEAGQVYGERCHIFSYACADVEDDGPRRDPPHDLSNKDRLLFELASSIRIGASRNNPMWVPSPEQLSRLKEHNRISVWEAWRGMALKESVVFLGTENINFNVHALPHNVENDYLPLYLYSLYQKYQLFVFADELMRKGAYIAQHLQEVRGLMDRFMDFRNKYWFNEVTRKPLGGELYRKFQQGLESPSLYEMVSAHVKDLKEYYEERRRRRIDALLNFFTFAFLPLSAVIGIFGMTFFNGSWRAFVIAFTVAGAISFGLWKWRTEEFGPAGE